MNFCFSMGKQISRTLNQLLCDYIDTGEGYTCSGGYKPAKHAGKATGV